MTEEMHRIVITSRSYGELSGVEIFVTDDLYQRLAKREARDGRPLIELLKIGRALQGLKHLIASIKESNKESKIIFNLDKTEKVGNRYFINYAEYGEKAQEWFFSLYKETGFDAASSYLNRYFPTEFQYDPNHLKESELAKVSKQLPYVLRRASQKTKNKVVLMEQTTRTLGELEYKSKASRDALLGLQRRSSLSFYGQRSEELKSRLTKDYPETRGKDSWQKWIYNNSWLFGVRYLVPIEKERIGFKEIPDFLFPTLDGFLDILEIKRPRCDVIRKDPAHRGSYAWSPDTNQAIGQVVNYMREMEENQLKLMKEINKEYGGRYKMPLHTVKPRAFILIGVSDSWDESEKDAFRTLNYSLHGVEVLTYSDLIRRGEGIISMLSYADEG